MSIKQVPVTAVGQPTLSSWESTARDVGVARCDRPLPKPNPHPNPDPRRLRGRLFGEDPAIWKPTFTFFGGYGSLFYNTSFELWGRAVLKGFEGGFLSKYNVIVTPHPGPGRGGAVEFDILRRMGVPVRRVWKLPPASSRISGIPDKGELTTGAHGQELTPAVLVIEPSVANSSEIAALSNITASINSTCGLQSLFVGVPALYIDSTGSFRDVAVAGKLITVASRTQDVIGFVETAQADGFRFDTRRLQAAGIPVDAAGNIADAVADVSVEARGEL